MMFIREIMKSLVIILYLLLFGCVRAQSPTVAISGVTVVDVRDGSLHLDFVGRLRRADCTLALKSI
jgi:hypothetical protein